MRDKVVLNIYGILSLITFLRDIKSMLLLIVDPQVDFVNGSLAVKGAPKAMKALSEYMSTHSGEIEHIVVTMDQHPQDHCSFIAQGGEWPPHCVRYTVGAAIEPCVAEALAECASKGIPIEIVEKATTSDRDAYSAFETDVPASIQSAKHILVAGLAGDYCVRQTVLDLERHGFGNRIELYKDGIAYIGEVD